MVMSKRLLKEYIRLLVNRLLLEADPLTTIGSTGTGSSISTSSTTSSKSATGTQSSVATGSGVSDEAIEELEAKVEGNNIAIKGLNTASGQLFNYTSNMEQASDEAKKGLSDAGAAADNLAKATDDRSRSDASSKMATGLKQSAASLEKITKQTGLTKNTFQQLNASTKTK